MTYYIIDIETLPQANLINIFESDIKAPKNIKDEKKIAQAIAIKKKESRKLMSTDTDFADIACIGIKELDQEAKIISLEELSKTLNRDDFKFITFNGKKFDIPIIIKQGIKQGLNLPYRQLKNMTERYSDKHIDLMEVIGEYGSYKSLDKLMQIYLGTKKTEIDFDNCTREELEAHCLEDLDNTEKLYKLFEPICL